MAPAVAQTRPSATVLVNGGPIAWRDVECSLDEGRPVLGVASTGHVAGEIADARTPDARRLSRSPNVHVVSSERSDEFGSLLPRLLEGGRA